MTQLKTNFATELAHELRSKGFDGCERGIAHLIDCNVITDKTMRDYLIISQYSHYLKKHDGNSRQAVLDMSVSFDCSERHVNYVIYSNPDKFKGLVRLFG